VILEEAEGADPRPKSQSSLREISEKDGSGTFLDRVLSKRSRTILIVIILLIPAVYTARQYSREHGLTSLLSVGAKFYPQAMPEFKAINPLVRWKDGYDGQFYAQIALDPSLRNPALAPALDHPEYRARRILLPALAFILGLGQPAAVVTAFTLLNVAFWYVLFAALVFLLRPQTRRDWLCIVAIVFTSGALHSLARSLTDLPAAVLCVLAAGFAGSVRIAALAAAVLTKDVYALGVWVPFVGSREKARPWWIILGQVLLILAPFAAWAVYVRSRFGATSISGNLDWPFVGWFHGIVDSLGGLGTFDALAAVSLLVQLLYLLLHRRPESAFWRLGITFGLAGTLLSADPGPFINQMSFTRDLLPMTIAFNILLMQERGRKFRTWFVAGNCGLAVGLAATLTRICWNFR
jgi:hypothetical protein